MHRPLVIPSPWAIVRHAAPTVVLAKVMPLVVFLGFLRLVDMTGALLAALAWSLGVISYQCRRGEKVPGLVVLTTIGLVAKTVAALLTGSAVVYFLQPTISTAMVGVGFLVSLRFGTPLAERLAHDFCPFDEATAEHPMLQLFFRRLSLLWAGTSLINAGFTLWLLFTQSLTTFVLVKSFTGPAFTGVTLLIAAIWFRRAMRRAGTTLAFSNRLAISAT